MHLLVNPLFRNYAANPTFGIVNVSLPSRNEVNVTVHDRLPGIFAAVNAYVEPRDGYVVPFYPAPLIF